MSNLSATGSKPVKLEAITALEPTASSQQNARFRLPMDLKVLETITPQAYLREYVVISGRRKNLYAKLYLKYKDPKLSGVPRKELEKVIQEVAIGTVKPSQIQDLFELVGVTEQTVVDQKLLAGVCALAERLIFTRLVVEETSNSNMRERIEQVDFSSMDYKFKNVAISDSMRKLLTSV